MLIISVFLTSLCLTQIEHSKSNFRFPLTDVQTYPDAFISTFSEFCMEKFLGTCPEMSFRDHIYPSFEKKTFMVRGDFARLRKMLDTRAAADALTRHLVGKPVFMRDALSVGVAEAYLTTILGLIEYVPVESPSWRQMRAESRLLLKRVRRNVQGVEADLQRAICDRTLEIISDNDKDRELYCRMAIDDSWDCCPTIGIAAELSICWLIYEKEGKERFDTDLCYCLAKCDKAVGCYDYSSLTSTLQLMDASFDSKLPPGWKPKKTQ